MTKDEQRKGCRAQQGDYISGEHVFRGNLEKPLKTYRFGDEPRQKVPVSVRIFKQKNVGEGT